MSTVIIRNKKFSFFFFKCVSVVPGTSTTAGISGAWPYALLRLPLPPPIAPARQSHTAGSPSTQAPQTAPLLGASWAFLRSTDRLLLWQLAAQPFLFVSGTCMHWARFKGVSGTGFSENGVHACFHVACSFRAKTEYFPAHE